MNVGRSLLLEMITTAAISRVLSPKRGDCVEDRRQAQSTLEPELGVCLP